MAVQVPNRHPRLGRTTIDGNHLFIVDMNTTDTVPESDCTNTEAESFFVAGEEGGVQQLTGEFTAITLKDSEIEVMPGRIYSAIFIHGSKQVPKGYRGDFYVSTVEQRGQVTQNGPSVWTGRGTFTGPYKRPGEPD